MTSTVIPTAKDKCVKLIVRVMRMPWPKTGSIIFYKQLGFRDKDCAIKGLVVYNRTCYGTYYEGLTLRCFQPSPEVLINAIV